MTPVTSSNDTNSSTGLQRAEAGAILLIISAVLGCIALILGLTYTYMHHSRMRARHRSSPNKRIKYVERHSHAITNNPELNEQEQKALILTHPFLIPYFMMQKSSDQKKLETSDF